MSINEWTHTLQIWIHAADIYGDEYKPEREQARLMVGSLLTVLEQDMSYPIAGCACHMCGMSVDEMEEYKSIFDAHAQAREMFV